MPTHPSDISDDGLVMRPANGHDRRRDRTRAALAAAMRELIAEQGLTGLQTGEVARRAGVSPGSFYNHFDSKEELVSLVVTDALTALTISMTVHDDADDPAKVVADAIRRFIGLVDDDPEFARFIVQLDRADDLLTDAVHPEARRALEEGVAGGRFIDIDIDTTLFGVLGGALAIMREMLGGKLRGDAAAEFAEIILRGLGVPEEDAKALVRLPLLPLEQTALSD